MQWNNELILIRQTVRSAEGWGHRLRATFACVTIQGVLRLGRFLCSHPFSLCRDVPLEQEGHNLLFRLLRLRWRRAAAIPAKLFLLLISDCFPFKSASTVVITSRRSQTRRVPRKKSSCRRAPKTSPYLVRAVAIFMRAELREEYTLESKMGKAS